MPTLATSSETTINTTTDRSQFYGDAVALPNGGWATMWLTDTGNFTYRVAVQTFGGDGQASGGETILGGAVQGQPLLAGLADGGFVIAYTSAGPNNTADIYAQRFDASGAQVGSQFMVNNGETRDQRLLELTPLEGGGFVAFFSQPQQDAPTSSPGHNPNAPPSTYVLTTQAFDAAGAKAGGYVALGPPVVQIPTLDVEPLPNGGYLIVSQGGDPSNAAGLYMPRLFAQAYDAGSQPVGARMTLAQGVDPQVAVLADGSFVVAYRATTNDTGDVGVQRYAADGAPIGPETFVQSDRYVQAKPEIEALADGGYLVTYYSNAEVVGPETNDDSTLRLYAQRFGADGEPVGGPMQLSDQSVWTSMPTAVAVRGDGDALVVWSHRHADNTSDVYGRVIPAEAVGAEDANAGLDLRSPGPGSTLKGGALNDTLTASQGGDTLTGGAGADRFALSVTPWSPVEITDFTVGTDSLDLRAIFRAAGVNSGAPEHYGFIRLTDDGAGGTKVLFDRDGAGTAQQWPDYVAHLQGVSVTGLTWTKLANGAPADQGGIVTGGASPPDEDPPSADGQVLTSPGPGSVVTGGSGDDTINASQGSDVLTGGAGDDVFAWAKEPWSPARITDFALGRDALDFSKLFQAAGYSGADPVADRYITFLDDGAGGTKVLFDRDGAAGGQPWPNYVLQLEKVSAAGLTWAQLAGDGASPPPPPPPPPDEEPAGDGQVLTSPAPGSSLTGGAGDDTLNASRGADTLTGAAGADRFVFADENWAPAVITDFQSGQDRIDLRGVLDDWGYAGTDPIGDGRVILLSDSAGTKVLLDDDGAGGDWGNYVLLIQGVQPNGLAAGDWLFQ